MNNILIPDFIRAITEKCNFTIKVNSADYDAILDITTFFVCKTYHATECSFVYDGPNKYVIDSFQSNAWIKIKGDLSMLTELSLKAPFFWQGTPIQIENVLTNIRDYKEKLPLIWLVEPYSSYKYEDPKSKLSYDADITLLFVLPQVNEDDCVEEQYKNLIEPIDNLVNEFREFIRKSPVVENFNGKSRTVNRVNMGEWVSKGGARKPMEDNIKRLFEELITATEYSPSFAIKKNFQCCSI